MIEAPYWLAHNTVSKEMINQLIANLAKNYNWIRTQSIMRRDTQTLSQLLIRKAKEPIIHRT